MTNTGHMVPFSRLFLILSGHFLSGTVYNEYGICILFKTLNNACTTSCAYLILSDDLDLDLMTSVTSVTCALCDL